MIPVLTSGGQRTQIRGLIDPGSEVNLASAAVIQRLGIDAQEVDVQIKSVGGYTNEIARRKTILRIITSKGPLNILVYIIPRLNIIVL